MDRLHRITHPNPKVAQKVNFFTDYFVYIASHIGISENTPLENPLSLIEKIIFQLESNIDKSHSYVYKYLRDSLIENEELMNGFEKYKLISPSLNKYKYLKSNDKKKTEWINNNPDFLDYLNQFKKELEISMFKKSLEAIISFLYCEHDLEKHKMDIKLHTRILVTEFYFTGKTKTDLEKIFDKIITKDIKKFAFPREVKTKKAKEKFIKSRTFNQQFEGIHNLLIQEQYEAVFYFRVNGILTENDFEFKYNKVTFRNSNHPYFEKAKKAIKDEPFIKNFFKEGASLVATLTIQYHSQELGRQIAIKRISDEIKYLKIITEANITIDSFTYLIIKNSKYYGSRWGLNSSVNLNLPMFKDLKNSPFVFLSKYKGPCLNKLLEFEHLFISAIESEKISDYWQYLEVLIPKGKNQENRIKDVVSHSLLLNAIDSYEINLKNYFASAINPLMIDQKVIGISKAKQNMYYRKSNFDLEIFNKDVSHVFINDTLTEWQSQKDLNYFQSFYYGILNEASLVRNRYLHEGVIDKKTFLKVYYTLPKLIMRYRWIIFDEIKRKSHTNFEELIEHIYKEGKSILLK